MHQCFMYGDIEGAPTDPQLVIDHLRKRLADSGSAFSKVQNDADRAERALQQAQFRAEERRLADNRAAAAVSMKRRKLGLSPIPPSEEYDVVQALDLGGGAEIHVVIYGTTEARAVARHMVGSAPLKL